MISSFLAITIYFSYSISQMYFLRYVFMLALGLFNSSFLNGLNVFIILFEVYIVILLSR